MKTVLVIMCLGALMATIAASSTQDFPGQCVDGACGEGYSCLSIQTVREEIDLNNASQCLAQTCYAANIGPCPSYSRWESPYDAIMTVCTYFIPDNATDCTKEVAGCTTMVVGGLSNVNVVLGCIDFDGSNFLFPEESLNYQLARSLNASSAVTSGCVGSEDKRLHLQRGFTGDYCDQVESNSCVNEADCSAGTYNTTANQCECDEASSGDQCANCNPDASVACSGQGSCALSATTGNYSCQCDGEWYGDHCVHENFSVNLGASTSGSDGSVGSVGSDEFAGSGSSLNAVVVTASKSSTMIYVGIGIGAAIITVIASVWWYRKRGSTSGKFGIDADYQSHEDSTANVTTDDPKEMTEIWRDPIIVSSRISRKEVLIGELLSRGGFGEVYQGIFNDQPVAIKMLHPGKRRDLKQVSSFLTEVKLMANLSHPCVVEFIGVAWNSLADLCAVSELMVGGNLQSLLERFHATGERTGYSRVKVQIAFDVANALTYLHSLSPVVIHRDLKSSNVMLNAELRAKLTDFGVSRERAEMTMTAGVGTALWMAPEVVMGERYNEKADVFSFGVVLSELAIHTLPYSDTGLCQTQVISLVLGGKPQPKFPDQPTTPEEGEIIALGKACLAIDPTARPSAAVIMYKLHILLRNSEAFV